ncbi:hypothetical protein M8C13_34380 [Crossiella sp. SN42]|uniref:hypothetical protein n=1 Tax=Crossiella sp. SN42 TaxID=2944808 RepID=UPI00207D5301|nr:hypothetical protein [Crossiella sp. SN42]MCO1580856.1 hypothetical protein [Crossiella sp. SN42]
MKTLVVLTAALATALTGGGFAAANPASPVAPPSAAQSAAEDLPELPAASANVEVVDRLPETKGAISINYSTYRTGWRQREVMFVSGEFGLKSYDVSNPDKPVFLDHLENSALALPGDDVSKRFWENEDVDVDHKRKLVFMARERTAFGRQPSGPRPTGVYILDAKDPADLKLVSFAEMGTGHTTTCINDCQYLWTAGYDGTPPTDPDLYKRSGKIFVTDIRDPRNPKTATTYVDLNRNQGKTHMTHDVQVDAAGIAWVAGTGGTRGYRTSGWHFDPLTKKFREATAVNPIPYAGGGVPSKDMPTAFSHNSIRPVGSRLADGPKPSAKHPAGSLLLHTEEAFGSPTCANQGRFVISSLKGSGKGESWQASEAKPFHLETVSVWSPHDQEGTITDAGCSAHYFDIHDRVVAYSFYGQGTRFLDVSDPARPFQIAYYRPEAAVSFSPYWHKGRAYIADIARGVEIVKLTKGADQAREAGQEVVLKTTKPVDDAVLTTTNRSNRLPLAPDPDYGWACPMVLRRGGQGCTEGAASCC